MRNHLLPLCVVLAASAAADFDYPDFSSTGGLTFVGSASTTGNRARICPSVPNLSGAMWHTTRQDVVAPWTATFTFE
ncbi:MAG: hypothetical protein O2816_19300, partial [Planctomycetota bacterium]|nr:hypothetical protein [Planctomycetota bacterium]